MPVTSLAVVGSINQSESMLMMSLAVVWSINQSILTDPWRLTAETYNRDLLQKLNMDTYHRDLAMESSTEGC